VDFDPLLGEAGVTDARVNNRRDRVVLHFHRDDKIIHNAGELPDFGIAAALTVLIAAPVKATARSTK